MATFTELARPIIVTQLCGPKHWTFVCSDSNPISNTPRIYLVYIMVVSTSPDTLYLHSSLVTPVNVYIQTLTPTRLNIVRPNSV